MKNSNKKTLNEIEIKYGMFLLSQELKSEYTKHLHDINVFDERGRMFCQCKIVYHQVRELNRIYDKHKSKVGNLIGYALEKDGLHLTFPRKLRLNFQKKKRYNIE